MKVSTKSWQAISVVLSATALLIGLLFVMAGVGPARAAHPGKADVTTYVVNTTVDENDGSCTDGDCSLRDAIILANTLDGEKVINFSIPGCGETVPCVLTLTEGALPSLTGGDITIDGFTQFGAAPPSATSSATINVILNGSSINSNGFNIISSGNTIRGLSIILFNWAGVSIWGAGATGNTIAGNLIGLTRDGFTVFPNGVGVVIGSYAADNTIGGDEYADRNVISGNSSWGITLAYTVTNNTVSGNYIGTDSSGYSKKGNLEDGIYIFNGAYANTIGGDTLEERNLISGNDASGLTIYGPTTMNNTVIGNYIGVAKNGTTDLNNGEHGVYIYGGAHHNTIGGDTADERNLISGNNNALVSSGVAIFGVDTSYNTVSGNYIGTSTWGSSAIPNSLGVIIDGGAHHNTIGGDTTGERNLISGNTYNGVNLGGGDTNANSISGNYIGIGISGSDTLPNGVTGVAISGGAWGNTVGGDAAGEGNVITGNGLDGVYLNGNGTQDNIVSGNIIGRDPEGEWIISGNSWHGVRIDGGAQYNTIGGDTPAERNLISGNERNGVTIQGGDTMSNTVIGNYIGVDLSGTSGASNSWHGVAISNTASYNHIGGDSPAERNLISGNVQNGVYLAGSGTAYNTITGNFISVDVSGDQLGGNDNGVVIENGANHNQIGGDAPGEGNLIGSNAYNAITIKGIGTDANTVTGNQIGINLNQTERLPNDYAIEISDGAQDNLVGGVSASAGNLIGSSYHACVMISGSGTTGNMLQNNWIGTTPAGASGFYCVGYGVIIVNNAQDNIIGPWNTITKNNNEGVAVDGSSTQGNVITQNSIYDNDGGNIILYNHANGDILKPTITGTSLGSLLVHGTACPDCTVEVFDNPIDFRQGRHYLGSGVADPSGNFTVTVGGLLYPYLTATATDVISGTSEFSFAFWSDNRSLFLPLIMCNFPP